MLFTTAMIAEGGGRAVPKHTDMEHLEYCVHALEAVILRDSRRLNITTNAGPVSFDQDC
jgi:hypothetical protein